VNNKSDPSLNALLRRIGFSREEASLRPSFQGATTDAFPAKAGPTKTARAFSGTGPALQMCTISRRTGFSREEACAYTLSAAVWRLTLSRLKPVLPREEASSATNYIIGAAMLTTRSARPS